MIDANGLHGQVAITKCGRAIISLTDETETGEFYTDGTRYKKFCRLCFPEKVAK